jgi:magnesium transporter
MPFTAFYTTPEGETRTDLTQQGVSEALRSKKGLLWVDITETSEEDRQFLREVFDFHPLAVEDCVSPLPHPPKIEDFGDYLFLITHGINYAVESDLVETTELDLFLGNHYVITNHNFFLYSVDAVSKRMQSGAKLMQSGPDFLVHVLLDVQSNGITPTIEQMADIADDIEDEAIRSPRQLTIEAILKLKRSALRLHRVLVPQQEVMDRMSRGMYSQISMEATHYYRNVYDHIARLLDRADNLRDRADNIMATYMSSVANRQNETMKMLAIVAAIFLPLSLVAGVYGMNFQNMPELAWSWGYFAVLGFMGTVIFSAMSWFWARKWLAWGRRRSRWVRPFTVEIERLVDRAQSAARFWERD